MKKIIDKKNLINLKNKFKKKKFILCHGVFDVIHYGHITHFNNAKKFGDILIVSVTKDIYIKKGINGTIFNELQRVKFLSEISVIDYVYLCETESAADSIKTIKPDFYVKGPDYRINSLDKTKKIYLEKKIVEKFNGKVVYTKDEKFSSSKIINEKNLNNYNSKQQYYINKIKNKYGYDYIKNQISKFKKLKILIIGELIFDSYCFGEIIGKSGKEPHLVLKENETEFYVGGTGAIARHLSSFVKNITLVSPFGNENFLKKVLKKTFNKNINQILFKPDNNYSSIIKKRFIDKVSNYKMFGSYILPSQPKKNFSNVLISKIKSKLINSDIVIICDYGHDFLNKATANYISKIKKFKTLNAQLNSSNMGYNSLNNYKNLEAVIINESELRQEFKAAKKDLNILAKNLMKKNNIKNLVITKGKNGVILFRKNLSPIHCPAFVDQSIDKVGAGDAMLSIISLALKQKINPEIVLFLGSIAAAVSVKNIGNKVSIDSEQLDRIIEFFFK